MRERLPTLPIRSPRQSRLLLPQFPLALGLSLLIALTAAACSDPVKPEPVKVVPDTASFGTDTSTVGTDQDTEDTSTEPQDIIIPELVPCAEPGGWGCECQVNEECLSGYCVDSEQGKVCTKTCTSNCPKDWKCVQTQGGDLIYVCLPKYSNLCKPCKSHDECAVSGTTSAGNFCVPNDKGEGFVDGSFCGTACAEDLDCKSGYTCKDVKIPGKDDPVKQCMPDSGECGCIPNWVALQYSTECSKTSEFGSCKATRACTEEGLTLCAATSPVSEVCDKEDNDCDGKTDEEGSINCVVWYKDNDLDGSGIGDGLCQCADPGAGYAKQGGDCNDLVAAIKPGADEICDNVDNNCNGDTDESGAKGCKVFYKDKDGDKFGDPDDSACLCPSKKTADWLEQGGDCDDTKKAVKPGVPELCNGMDDDCDGKTDEEGAEGCKLFYVDSDGDGYGPAATAKCLCDKNKLYSVDQPGDCDDNNNKVKPTALEVCNGVDDDCNTAVDDGDAPKSCPAVSGGTPGCTAGKCGVGNCGKGLFDVNGSVEDGCECKADSNYGVKGDTCGSFIEMGNLPDGGATMLRSGNVMPGEGGDWYHFVAVDTPDMVDGACDNYHVRIKFTTNPGNQFVFDVFRGSCAAAHQICTAETQHNWATSFYGSKPDGPQNKGTGDIFGDTDKSPVPEKGGECKCAPPKGNQKGALPGMNLCSDNTAHYYVRVYRKPGMAPTCDAYTVDFDNSPAAWP